MEDHRCVARYRDGMRERVEEVGEALARMVGNVSCDELADEESSAIVAGAVSALAFVSNVLLEGMADDYPEGLLKMLDKPPAEQADYIVGLGMSSYYKYMVA